MHDNLKHTLGLQVLLVLLVAVAMVALMLSGVSAGLSASRRGAIGQSTSDGDEGLSAYHVADLAMAAIQVGWSLAGVHRDVHHVVYGD